MPVIELKKQDRTVSLDVYKRIQDEEVQKKCYIAELIKIALNNYLDFDDLRADSTYSAYRLPIVNEDTDIIDFEINSLSVHVIPTVDKSQNTNVYIPKSYRTYTCKPDVIVFVNFTKGLTKMDIVGFVTNIDLSSLAINKSQLSPADDLIDVLKTLKTKQHGAATNAISAAKELMLSYIESSLSEEGRQFFLKHLLAHKEIRKNYKLFYALNCDFISIANEHKTLSEASTSNSKLLPTEQEYNENPIIITDETQQTLDEEPIVTEQVESEQLSFEDEELAEVNDIFPNTDEIPETIVEIDEGFEEIADVPEEQVTLENTELAAPDEIAAASDETMNTDTELVFSDEDESFELTDMEDFSLEDAGEEIVLEENNDDEPVAAEVLPVTYSQPVEPEPQEVQLIAPDETSSNEQEVQQETGIEGENEEITLQEEQPEANAESGDDIFSFLSEMAEESQEENQITENTDADAETPNSEEPYISSEENSVQENTQEEENLVQQEIPIENIVGAEGLNNAFEPQDAELANEQPTPAQEPETIQKKKVSAIPLIAAAAILGAVGVGIVLNKDKIPFLNQGDTEIQDIAKDGTDTVLPAPISDSDLPPSVPTAEKTGETPPPPSADSTAKVPLPPTAQNNNPDAEKTPPQSKTAQKTDDSQLPSLPSAVEPPKPKHLNDAIANALTKDFSGVRISKVSWEISETLINNPEVKRYLTIAGKSVKNALSQDLMAATEPSMKDSVTVDITYKKDGTISNVKIASSSGSSQIDNIVTKSVKETLNYVKMPSLNINKPEYAAKLIVRL